MSDPGSTRPDPCSIRLPASKQSPKQPAALSADDCPPRTMPSVRRRVAGDRPPRPGDGGGR